jgi:cytosine/adenosine deaminase-related metal-dependent hydrolase
MKTLLSGGAVVAPERPELLAGGDLLIDGATIAELGPAGSIPRDGVARILDTTGSIVLPGLINSHQHDWYLYGKGLGCDVLLEQWITGCLVPLKEQLDIDDLRVASELATLDMLRGGTTSSVNHLVNETTLAEEEAILGPVADAGVRQFFAKVIRPHDAATDYASARESFEKWDRTADGRIRVGVRVSIGTDGPMVDLTNDMVEQIKWTRLLQNQLHEHPGTIELGKLIEMATQDGARAVRAEQHLGTLAPGFAADISVFDLATLHAGPVHRPLATFVHAARGTDAQHVFVNGEQLLDNGRFTRVDDLHITDLLRRASDRAKALGRRAGLLPRD